MQNTYIYVCIYKYVCVYLYVHIAMYILRVYMEDRVGFVENVHCEVPIYVCTYMKGKYVDAHEGCICKTE